MDLETREAFALADDREAVLGRLVQGTDDADFLRCLELMHQGKLSEARELLDEWVRRRRETSQTRALRDRLALLAHDDDPKATREHLRRRLGPSLSHQRHVEGEGPTYPTRLDPSKLTWETLARRGRSYTSRLGGLTDAALERLLDDDLDWQDLRALLERRARPDAPGLVRRIREDLEHDRTGGFGSLELHRSLTTAQLDELASRPLTKKGKAIDLRRETEWVHTRLRHLHPGPDVRWEEEPAAREAYLEALWSFVQPLDPAFNDLKAHVLYHRLDHDRGQGAMSRERLLAYLGLPIQASYRDADWMKANRTHAISLGGSLSGVTLLEDVSDDEELVRAYLGHFLRDADGLEPFDTYVRDAYLERVQAEEKLLAGLGETAVWTDVLGVGAVEALTRRVDLDLAAENPTAVAADAAVRLLVDVKNVPKLTLKLFEINAFNFYVTEGREVDTALDLDGLEPAHQESFSYDEPPIRRVRRTFDLPQLDRPGVFVVELIGEGKSSRALIQKGCLRMVERCGAAGHVLTILDETGRPAPDATAWIGGRELKPKDDGRIRVPYSSRPGRIPVVLRRGGQASLVWLDHRKESYRFTAGIFVDREQLISGGDATVWVSPRLELNDERVPLSLVEEPVLAITSTDRHGTESSREVTGFELHDEQESTFTFRVPDDLARIAFTVRGRLQTMTGDRVDVSASGGVSLNGIETTDRTRDLHLARTAEGWVLSLLGKNGEPRADVALNVRLRSRWVTFELDETLQTDARGRIELGTLPDVTFLRASTPDGYEGRWDLERGWSELPTAVHARVGEAVRIPAPVGTTCTRDCLALLEGTFGGQAKAVYAKAKYSKSGSKRAPRRVEAGRILADRFEALAVEPGAVVVRGLGPGDYELTLKAIGQTVNLRVAEGEPEAGWIVGSGRWLERLAAPRLTLTDVEVAGDAVTVRLQDAGKRTRVHLIGTRFLPEQHVLDLLGVHGTSGLARELPDVPECAYVSGRELGDEYRYVLDRRDADKFPGNMLARPGLLLNPWAVRDTSTGIADAEGGEDYAANAKKKRAKEGRARRRSAAKPTASTGQACLDFLPHRSALRVNERPGEDGAVRVPRDAFAHANQLHVVVLDPDRGTIYREVGLPEVEEAPRDQRLRLGLDPAKHYAERRDVTLLSGDGRLVVEDATTAEVEVYDTLAKVYRLFQTLSGNDTLDTFGFVVRWPDLSDERKLELYSEYACHELNLFLKFKDPEFFARVVQPFVRNKLHRTFMDRYLLEEDLSGYLEPWAYGRLNVVERILLAQRTGGDEGDAAARHLDDLLALRPKDPRADEERFRTAVRGSALDSGGLSASLSQAAEKVVLMSAMATGGPGGGGGMGFGGLGGAPMPPPMASPAAPKARRSAARRDSAERGLDEFGDMDDMLCDMAGDEPWEAEECEAEPMEEMAYRKEKAFFRKQDTTQELAENAYYKLRVDQMGPELVTVNAFWRDFARHRVDAGPFLSGSVAEACRNFTEMMCALAVLGLPFGAAELAPSYEGARLELAVDGPALAFHKEIRPTEPAAEQAAILVTQSLLRADDRYRYDEGGEQVEKPVTGELVVDVVYVCAVVLTNPTATAQKLDLLMQIPRGALPVNNGFMTKGSPIHLGAYETQRIEYAFYFPFPGEFAHFPVHVAKSEELVGAAEARPLTVVERPTQVDTSSWAWVSQQGSSEDVLAYVERENVERLDLDQVAWRVREDAAFFDRLLSLLERRHVYSATLWAYALVHGDRARLATYLRHQESYLRTCGEALACRLLDVDPVERGWYQHLEYAPLINARAHPLGGNRRILNDRFGEQYDRLLSVLSYKARPEPTDALAAVIYLLLQDRIAEALARLDAVDGDAVDARLQYDYLRCYALFFSDRPEGAREIAAPYADYPVLRWRRLFKNVLAHLDEAFGAAAQVTDGTDRDQAQGALAASEAILELKVEDRTVTLQHRGLSEARISYYPMDVELLFSRQPFVQQQSSQFAFITPRQSDPVELSADGKTTFSLPDAFQSANLVVEVTAGGLRRTQAYYAHSLRVEMIETYGQVRVAHATERSPLPRTYVKCYARMSDGAVRFFKDGYTDLRGRFDYASLSTDDLDRVERFALLLLHPEHGAVTREVEPPRG